MRQYPTWEDHCTELVQLPLSWDDFLAQNPNCCIRGAEVGRPAAQA